MEILLITRKRKFRKTLYVAECTEHGELAERYVKQELQTEIVNHILKDHMVHIDNG